MHFSKSSRLKIISEKFEKQTKQTSLLAHVVFC